MKPLLLCAVFAAANFAQVDAPVLGYLPDNGRVRPILGIPESAVVAPPLDDGPFARIAIAGQTVLASRSDSGAIVLYQGKSFIPIPGATASPDVIALSPQGTAAVLWFAARTTAEVISGLGGTPVIRQVTAPFRPTTPALAISDDGEWLAGIWPAGLQVFARDRQPALLRIDGRPRALAFAPGSAQLAVATQAGILSIDDIGGNAIVTPRQDAGASLARPIAVAYAGETIVAVDASGAILADGLTDCQCQPDSFQQLAPGVFRITDLHSGSARIFDARTETVLFAPLSLAEAAQ